MDGRRRTLILSLGAVAVMLGLVAASVPLYRLFCRVTGYAGTPQIALGAPVAAGEGNVIVRFDANVMPDMPWRFWPERTALRVRLGETTLALFRAENVSKEPIIGTAAFNVTPAKAAIYVNKIQCFCFTQQRLAAGEKAEFPVSFYVDPKLAADQYTADVRVITLSYTFFKSRDQAVGARTPEDGGRGASGAVIELKEGRS